MEGTARSTLVGDASVLIDIADANEAVLGLIAQHLARVIIPFLVWIYTDPPLTPEMQLPPELLRLKAEKK